jgi:hypothetical protein
LTGAVFDARRFLLNRRAAAPKATRAITTPTAPTPMPAFAPVLSPELPAFESVMDGDDVFPAGFEDVEDVEGVEVVELVVAGFGKI